MSKGYFTDKTIKPTDNEINRIIGNASDNWNMIINYLSGELKLKGELKFYGVNYGWALRFNKSGKSVIALYPGYNNFTAQIILNTNQVEQSLADSISENTKDIINNTEAIPEGK